MRSLVCLLALTLAACGPSCSGSGSGSGSGTPAGSGSAPAAVDPHSLSDDRTCVRCHTDVVDLEPMPWTRVGAGYAPAVAWAPSKDATPAPRYPGQGAVEGQAAFLDHGCHGCHAVPGLEDEPPIGPGLAHVASKLDPAWVRRWIAEPRAFSAHTRMPQLFGVARQLGSDGAEPTTDADAPAAIRQQYPTKAALYGAIEKAEMSAVVAALFARSGTVELAPPKAKGDPERGQELFLESGCVACHTIDDYETPGEPDRRFGPDLSHIRHKLRDAVALPWLVTWLRGPARYHAGARMPDPRLTDKEAAHLAAYLATKRGADDLDALTALDVPDPPRALVELRLQATLTAGGLPAPEATALVEALREPASGAPSKAQLVWLGERVMARQGCHGCHDMGTAAPVEALVRARPGAWKRLGSHTALARTDFRRPRIPLSSASASKVRHPAAGVTGYERLSRLPWYELGGETAASLAVYVAGLRDDDAGAPAPWPKAGAVRALQRANAAESWVTRAHADWQAADRSAYAALVERLTGYDGTSRRQARVVADVADALAAKTAPTEAQILDVWLMGRQLEGTLAGWTDAERRKAIVAGRKLIRRHGCRGCHQIEGRGGDWVVFQSRFYYEEAPGSISLAAREEAPPWLDRQGERARPGWLTRFLMDPDQAVKGGVVRRWLTMKMPRYGFDEKQARTLVRYFAAVNGTPLSEPPTPEAPTDAQIDATLELMKHKRCLTCHGEEVTGSRAAPLLELTGPRLRPAWVRRFLLDPRIDLPYTSMIPDTLKDENEWVERAHALAREHARVLAHPKTVAELRELLGN